MNNPMMDMFKKAFENPTAGFSQSFEAMKSNDMTKFFNPTAWVEMSNKMLEHMPWLNLTKQDMPNTENAFNFANNIQGMDVFSDLSHLSLENTQAMLRRQAEIIQRHSSEMNKFLQNMSSNPETNITVQADFIRNNFESLVNDFKELSEMYSKANLETFEAASNKVAQKLGKKPNCDTDTSCSMKDAKPASSGKAKS